MSLSRLRALALAIFGVGVVATNSVSASAQGAQGAQRSVSGRVRRPMGERGDSTGMGPAVGTWVTLHRVGRDSSGALDSVRTDADGRYTLRYRPFGAPDALYFASSTWHGIAYFTAPLREAQARGDDGEITVFDTTSHAITLGVKGRHLIIGGRDTSDMRTIIEVFELSNDSLLTLVASGTGTPTWRTRIPKAATNIRVNEGEISPDAFRAADGEVQVFAPIAPGLKQLSFTYALPASAFPFAIDAAEGAVVFEVLAEEDGARVDGAGFTKVADVTIEGRHFERWLAQDLRPDSRVAIDVPARGALSGSQLRGYGIAIAAGFFALLLIGRTMQRSAAKRADAPRPTLRPQESDAPLAERLAAEIAALDATFAKQASPSDAVRQAYETRRTELKAALTAALAGQQVLG